MALDVGIIGAGNIAESRHLPTYKSDSRTNISAIYDVDKKKSNRVADQYDAYTSKSAEDLYQRVDAVSICTPPSEHCRQTVEALRNDCHVITEKPMAMSSSEAQKMVDTANKEGKMLSVVHNFKFMSEVRKARAMVKNGDIGDVERVNAVLMKREGQSKEYVQRAKSSGDIGIKYWDESPHMIYLVKSFMDDIELSAAEVCENQSNDGYKRIKARFSGNSLSEASISFLWDSPVTEWWIIVTGTEGILFIDIYRNIMVNLSRESEHTAKSVMYVLLDTCQQLLFGTAFSGVKYIKDRFVNGYKIPDAGFSHQIQRFVDAIERGHELPVTGVDGKAVLDHMIEIQEMSDISINN